MTFRSYLKKILFIGAATILLPSIGTSAGKLNPEQLSTFMEFAENCYCREQNYTLKDAMDKNLSCWGKQGLIMFHAQGIVDYGWTAEQLVALTKGESSTLFQPDISGLQSIGSDDAEIAIIEFTDPQCPFCTNYTNKTFPSVKKDYIDSGKVKYFYSHIPLPFHTDAFLATEASYCAADQGGFHDYHAILMRDERRIKRPHLVKHAKEAGLDAAIFSQCLDSHKHKDKVQAELDVRKVAGPTSFPFFVVGTYKDGKFEAKTLATEPPFGIVSRSTIDKAIDKAEKAL